MALQIDRYLNVHLLKYFLSSIMEYFVKKKIATKLGNVADDLAN